ncbi:hypothetical protein Q7A53_18980 [Halobacillus rhizosphaerae]|uniref:hypothetical protein n=1 Tax=Halobacillus rhizosphaerae TaxID=3064889 RepID=UPI00398B0F06
MKLIHRKRYIVFFAILSALMLSVFTLLSFFIQELDFIFAAIAATILLNGIQLLKFMKTNKQTKALPIQKRP